MTQTDLPKFAHASFQGRIGLARVDITPPVGIYARNWGAATHDRADSIHRPLTLTAFTLADSSSERPLVLVDADLGWWKTPDTFGGFQVRLLEELSLSPSQLVFALSHTHAGPSLIEPDDSLPGSDLLRTWLESLVDSTIQAVRTALDSQFDAILDWHTGRCGLATIRDFPDPDRERDGMLLGYSPQGEPDDTLLVGRVTDANGQLRATLVNYACHPTTLAWDNTAISPDYVGAMRDVMQRETGVPALFLLGACGDLAPRFQYVGDTQVADRHGRQLAYAALSTLSGMEPPGTALTFVETVESGARLAVWKHEPRDLSHELRALQPTVDLPLKNWPTGEELEQQRVVCTDRAVEERLRRQRDIRLALGDGPSFALPVSFWRIGDVVFVGSCCEAYSLLQRRIRQRFPNRTIVCMNLINGSIGYLPPANLYGRDVYPAWQTPFDRGSLELAIDAMTDVISHLFVD